jgi:hypothetical protein
MSEFDVKSPRIMRVFMDHLGLKDFQAAGALGNFGRESAGLVILHEIGKPPGEGGDGWGMWTGPRALEFHAWCGKHGVFWESDEANLGYALQELTTNFKATVLHLRQATTVEAATASFEKTYEMAGVVALSDRIKYARTALAAFRVSPFAEGRQ